MHLTVSIGAGQALLYGLLGYAVVFFGLILLMLVVILFGKAFTKKQKAAAPAEEAPAPVVTPVAPGSAGQMKLHTVEPKIAAMLMAIVADKLGKPLNELRFISIQEVSR